jgi:transmembrane sensor
MDGKVNKQVIEEASNWFVDFRVGDTDAQHRQEFHEWLRRSPDHIQAYLDIAMTYAELPAPDIGGEIDVQALIDHARSSAQTNIIALELPAPETHSGRRPRASGPKRRVLAIAASVVLAIALGSWLYVERETYSTGVGEQRSVILADGSTVQLNSRSRVRVRYSDHERHIVLLEGQALFQVARNKQRPFVVDIGDTKVRAVGTQFDVYRKHTGTIITVVEGKVSVDFAGTADAASFLTAGEQLMVSAVLPANAGIPAIQPVPMPKQIDISTATAWTQRQLIFENASLWEVAEEFNRYSARPIIVETGVADNFHVSGTYSSANHESLLRFLRVQPGIKLIETDREIRIAHE